MDDTDVISGLRRTFGELSQTQKRIAEVIVEDPEFVAFATVDKVAGRLGVSPSTVVRFAYRIGLNGYQDLQDRVRQVVRSQMRSRIVDGESASELTAHLGDTAIGRSLAHDAENLSRTIVNLNLADLDRAVTLLSGARRVFVVGTLTSYSVAFFLALALDRIRGDAYLMTGDERSAATIRSVEPTDVVVAITFPPYASSTLRAASAARARGATLIGITDTPISPVGQRVDVVLPALVSGITLQNSLVAATAVANALVNGVIARSEGALDRYREVLHLMDEWDQYVLKEDDPE
jgi:DNA-binding MurR/RpiR family transcriptional regulator